ncbi:hypothetical protein O7623_08770 [Solwaraspora sp. WMMD791]|uniref:hypothetical protein n=1 Tax=Solwaraspora sp. WMMD791 TaxID=3016086 RepID=UPI00249C1C9C|nr:hypothetical protein [Solwaraspora sp. WMMD791]WFE29263.1 hypothetical protein O7623_08770 [Solwaraspora sp. WMMD791]
MTGSSNGGAPDAGPCQAPRRRPGGRLAARRHPARRHPARPAPWRVRTGCRRTMATGA